MRRHRRPLDRRPSPAEELLARARLVRRLRESGDANLIRMASIFFEASAADPRMGLEKLEKLEAHPGVTQEEARRFVAFCRAA